MLKMERKLLDHNPQYFKATLGKIVEEIDFTSVRDKRVV